MKQKFIILLILVFPLISSAAQERGFEPFLYELSYDGARGYLIGTMHVGRSSYWGLTPEIHTALDNSEALYLEISYQDQADANLDSMIFELFPLDENFDLRKDLGEDYWQVLRQKIPILDENSLKTSHPIAIAMTMDLLMYFKQGLALGYGVDFLLSQEAYKRGIEIKSLELPESQIHALGLLYEDPVLSLKEALDRAPTSEDEVKQMIRAFERGDEIEMLKLVSTMEDQGEEYWQAMLIDRNIVQANGILEALQNEEKPFAAVGAAHLVGEGSVIELLTELGVNVRRIRP
jgi:uncharacterized protein YbaP (TraB family)